MLEYNQSHTVVSGRVLAKFDDIAPFQNMCGGAVQCLSRPSCTLLQVYQSVMTKIHCV